jgi:hexosaminidase
MNIMKNIAFLILALSLLCVDCNNSKVNIAIIPKPASVVRTGGYFKMKNEVAVYCPDAALSGVIRVFSEQVSDRISVKDADRAHCEIEVTLEAGRKPESYSMEIKKGRIQISSGGANGVFYGLQSLRQLIINSEKKNDRLMIPCCKIDDSPAFSWRGLMLDESRHFFGIDKVRQLLDMMSMLKMNIFHWHLTDVPGWRLEIKKYPLLTTVGGKGNHNDPEAPAKFYTQEQIKEIVKYAQDRFIQIVPEIDMPGHAGASNRAYPEFSGGGSERYPEFTFHPGKEGTYSYLTDILREVSMLFPSPYIHLGGDEVNFGNQQWNSDRQVKLLMKKNNLADLKAVEKYFVLRMADSINKLKKTAIGWDEIVDSEINPAGVVVMWWRHDRQGQLKTALEKHYNVVLCPRIPLYFDFVQDRSHKWGRKNRAAVCDLETVYRFPPDTLSGYNDHRSQVLGIQANLWTEVMQNNKRLDFMTYPRITALAEAAWTKKESKDYNDFLLRLKPLLPFLKAKGIYYFDPFDPSLSPEAEGI